MGDYPNGHDEYRLTREAFPEVMLDPRGAERARARLLSAIELERVPISIPERSKLARGWRWGVAVASLVLLALVLQVFLPAGLGGPPVTAAVQLARLGDVAASARPAPLGPGDFAYSLSVVYGPSGGATDVTSGASFERIQLFDQESWIGIDGSGRFLDTYVSARFATPEDERIWQGMGSPPIERAGDRVSRGFGPGELDHRDLANLPTDVVELERVLERQEVIRFGDGDAGLFYAIGTLLARGDASVGLRTALFRVAATLPGVETMGTVRDPFERTGVGIAVPHADGRAILIFDPATSVLLAREFERTDTGSLESWTAYLASGVVDTPGAQPPA